MNATALESVLRRDRMIVAAALAMLIAMAWVYIVALANSMASGGMSMGGMPMHESASMNMDANAGTTLGGMLAPAFKPWTIVEFTTTFVMWAVMMVGMMMPSAAPMILIYARVGRQAALQGKPFAATGFFAGGYLLAWFLFSLAATGGQWALDRAALLTPMMATTSDVLGALVLIAAGLFQWTPVKDVCLKHCQAPLSFIQHHGGFRRDALGSLAIGFRHGTYCVGCCWALMALLFVGGVMNVLWIAGLAIFVLLEKVIPLGRIVSRVAGVALTAWGMWLLVAALR
ncbi:MAG TPA: DUF2182 domain-containing protein [Pseudolabrys sp.]|jgi:predicted metal-binding membrane protein|nr:DUF2182 domain-containing protein [Pseudolabrys sp.]